MPSMIKRKQIKKKYRRGYDREKEHGTWRERGKINIYTDKISETIRR